MAAISSLQIAGTIYDINAKSALSAGSAKNAATASYATSAGAAPVASHNHNYTISAGTNPFYLSAGVQLSAGANIQITSAGTKTIGISAKDTTYGTANFITATHLSNIQTASGYATSWSDNSANVMNSAKSGWSALSSISANSSTWANDTKVSQKVTSDNVFYPILTKDATATTTITAGARFADVVTVNPSSKMVRANKFGITSSATMEFNSATNSIDFIFN